jgi:hypothetical protein
LESGDYNSPSNTTGVHKPDFVGEPQDDSFGRG